MSYYTLALICSAFEIMHLTISVPCEIVFVDVAVVVVVVVDDDGY
jgi:hypothetical protein